MCCQTEELDNEWMNHSRSGWINRDVKKENESQEVRSWISEDRRIINRVEAREETNNSIQLMQIQELSQQFQSRFRLIYR